MPVLALRIYTNRWDAPNNRNFCTSNNIRLSSKRLGEPAEEFRDQCFSQAAAQGRPAEAKRDERLFWISEVELFTLFVDILAWLYAWQGVAL
jgi:hypothetical protein